MRQKVSLLHWPVRMPQKGSGLPVAGTLPQGRANQREREARRALRVRSARTCQLPSSLPGRDAKLSSSKMSSSPVTS